MKALFRRRRGHTVFLAALVTRLLGVALTTLTELNTYAQADADRFAASAGRTAATLRSGQFPVFPTDPDRVVTLWGIILSPFWLVPGPSRLYARLFTAVLGALAVYGVYKLAVRFHSSRAGLLAILPLVCYPSYILVHSTILREACVLAGLVGATYVLSGDPTWPSCFVSRITAAVLILTGITIVRWENVPVYLLVVGVATVVRYRSRIPRWRAAAAAATVCSGLGLWLARPAVYSALEWLSFKRFKRSEGRTVYFPSFRPDTLPKAALFAPVGAIYFLFTPFLWMVETAPDLVVFVEALGNMIAFGAAVVGIPDMWRQSEATTAALVIGFVVAATMYGLVNANVGTVVRQRQMVLWVMFLFAGVAIADRAEGERWPV